LRHLPIIHHHQWPNGVKIIIWLLFIVQMNPFCRVVFKWNFQTRILYFNLIGFLVFPISIGLYLGLNLFPLLLIITHVRFKITDVITIKLKCRYLTLLTLFKNLFPLLVQLQIIKHHHQILKMYVRRNRSWFWRSVLIISKMVLVKYHPSP
jgi:hypothetical protein